MGGRFQLSKTDLKKWNQEILDYYYEDDLIGMKRISKSEVMIIRLKDNRSMLFKLSENMGVWQGFEKAFPFKIKCIDQYIRDKFL